MTRKELLEKAEFIVNGKRDAEYGGPEKSFNDIADLWCAYLGQPDLISPEDVAIMMILLKVARLKGSEYESIDSWVDIAGYAACGGEIVHRYTKAAEEK